MAKGMPSMLALLGLVAVAGYQNRDKISEALKGAQTPGRTGRSDGGLLGGLGDLMDSFKSAGQSETADSWVTPGVPTKGLTPQEVERAIGSENLDELSTRTGLSREDLLQRLATAIPETVDRLTPEGRWPTDDQARQFFGA